MNQNEDNSGIYSAYQLSIALLILLLAGVVFFYKERMFFVDPDWVAFNIINTHRFSIAENRYGALISQVFPLIGTYLNLSVKSILILYSASFYIFYLAVALITGMVFKQKGLAILLACYFSLVVSDVYFWPNNEVHQGIAWMMLFLALFWKLNLTNSRIRWYHHLVLLIYAFLAIFSHFIIIVAISFLWLYLIIDNKQILFSKKRIIVFSYSIILIVLFFARYQLSTNSWYDGAKLDPVKNISFQGIISSFSSGQAKTFFKLFLKNYWLLFPICGIGYFFLIRQKKYLQFLLSLSFLIGYFSLICITYPEAYGRELLFYMESEWMTLGLLAATPFVFNFLPKMSRRNGFILFAIIFTIRLGYILNAYPFFHQRYVYLDTAITSLKEEGKMKSIIRMDEKTSQDLWIMDWGLATESIMLSKVKGYEPQVTFKIIRKDVEIRNPKDSFYSAFNMEPISFLNKNYFRLDTSSYSIVEEKEFIKWLEEKQKTE